MEMSYKKILLKIVPLVLGIVVVLYLILFRSYELTSAQERSETAIINLWHAYERLELMSESINNIGLNMLYDNEILPILYGEPDRFELQEGTSEMRVVKNISPYIESVYIWNENRQTLYSTGDPSVVDTRDRVSDKGIFDIVEQSDRRPMVVPRRISEFGIGEAGKDVYSYFYFDYVADSFIVINVLLSTVTDLFYEADSETMIVSREGLLQSVSESGPVFSDVSELSYVKEALERQETEGSFIDKAGEKKLVAFIKPQDQGDVYIRVYPYDQINGDIIRMRNLSLVLTALVLVLGVIWSVRISRKIYQPIDEMSVSLKKLQADKRQHDYRNRQQTLQLLFDEIQMNQNDMPQKLIKQGVQLDHTGYFSLAMFKIDDYSVFCQKYSTTDRDLFSFAIGNIANEIMSVAFRNEAIEMPGNQVVLLIQTKEAQGEQEKKRIQHLCREIQEKVKEYLKFSVSCILSESVHFDELPVLYGGVKDAEQYRMYLGKESLFCVSDMIIRQPSDYSYPVETETELVKELNLGNVAKAKAWYLEMVNSLYFYPMNVLSANLLRLSVAIYKVIPAVEYKSSSIMYHYNDIAARIAQCEIIDEVNQLFFGFFEAIGENQSMWRDSKHNQLMDKINRIIREESGDSNLSLEVIADRLSLSSDYVGKLYKKYTGKTITNCVNEERIENAKRLLLETKLTVGQVSEQAGFLTNQYFLSLFKKMNGLTPSEFRKMYKQD